MEFLTWHYSYGFEYYIKSWSSTFDWINHYFSLPLLLKTLFSPWKRLVTEDKSPGFNPSKYFEALTFNLVSRGIGAAVRFSLFWIGIFFIIFAFLGGVVGLFLWVALPFLSLGIYSKYKHQPANYVKNLLFSIKSLNQDPLQTILNSSAGQFMLERVGLSLADLVNNANREGVQFTNFNPGSYGELVNYLLANKVWTKEFLHRKEIEPEDLILAANWWDLKTADENRLGGYDLGRPGLALELLFGYTPTLNQYSVDLSTPQSFSHHLIGRENVVLRMERILKAGTSVSLVGEPGVGKKTVVLELAHRAAGGKLGGEMAYRRVLEFDYNALLSGSTDLNMKKTQLAQVLNETAAAGNIILMVRDIQRLTNMSVEGYDFTDVFESHLANRELKIIAISTPDEYERFIAPNLRLRKYLEKVEVTQPTMEEAKQILIEAAKDWEIKAPIVIQMPALRKILDESDKYITETPFPEKALELLDAVVTYIQQAGTSTVNVDSVNAVLEEKTGISFTRLTEDEKTKLTNLEEIIHKRLVDQEVAIKLIAKILRSRSVGVSNADRPVGSFLFLGPTGVGKTETAKVLAKVYYGNESHILRFDMAEFAGTEGLERLIGSVNKNLPGEMTTAIKNHPASILLLDEFEKATREIYNLFLTLLDEGYINDAFGKKINCRNLFVIGTSNAGSEFIRQFVNKGESKEKMQEEVVNYVLEKQIFSPEFLNRFDGVVVYEPLNEADLIKIADLILKDLAHELEKKNLYLTVTDGAARKLAQDGYDPAFGARPMRRIVNIDLGDLIGKALLSKQLVEGDKFEIVPQQGKNQYEVVKIS